MAIHSISKPDLPTQCRLQQIAAAAGQPLSAVILGSDLESLSGELANKKLDKAYRIEHGLLKDYTADGYVSALEQPLTGLLADVVTSGVAAGAALQVLGVGERALHVALGEARLEPGPAHEGEPGAPSDGFVQRESPRRRVILACGQGQVPPRGTPGGGARPSRHRGHPRPGPS